eukprot:GEMP01029465.1.p1 GENE.GEMP01029465.1~~GEMP01029465.1.p1  ORF type:complete len:312 (+),score=43.43 GEMP01029465.1:113-1048(+)
MSSTTAIANARNRQDDEMPIPSRSIRLGHCRKLLPLLMIILIATMWFAHTYLHCVPLMQLHKLPKHRVRSDVERGMLHFFLLLISVTLLMASYVRAIMVLPGYVPNTREWAYTESDDYKVLAVDFLLETKEAGGNRRCKKCATPKYKPDRAHHCRVCQTCVLRMDHHCPWIYNCVGFYNYKYFFLLLFYTAISLHIVAWTFWSTTVSLVTDPRNFVSDEVGCLAIFVETFAIAGSIAFTGFWGYHAWLVLRGMSSIEHLEKNASTTGSSMWNLGMWNNIEAVLGPYVALWFLPCSSAVGNGLRFASKAKTE